MDETIKIGLEANPGKFIQAFGAAENAVSKFGIAVEASGVVVGIASKSFEKAEAAVRRASKAMVAGGVAIQVGLGLATKSAGDFQARMLNVQSISKLTSSEFDRLGESVKRLSSKSLQSANDLAEGLYEVSSSGFAGADALTIVEQASLGASAGLSSTDIAAKAITATLNAYGFSAAKAADINDILFKTVELGVISFEELALGMGDWLATAAAVGVGADEAAAAIATMTLAGIQAPEAGTSLNRLLQSFIDPSEQLTQQVKELGYASALTMLQTEGLQGTIIGLDSATGGSIEAFNSLFPEIRAVRGALALTAADGANYARVVGEITSETGRAGAAQAAFEVQASGLNSQMTLLKNAVSELMISVGEGFLPILTRGVEGLKLFADVINSIPSPIKKFSGVMMGLASVIAIGAGAMGLFFAKARVWQFAMRAVQINALRLAATTGGPLAKGLTLVASQAGRATTTMGPLGAAVRAAGAGMNLAGVSLGGFTVAAGALAGVAVGVVAVSLALKAAGDAAMESGRKAASAFAFQIETANLDEAKTKLKTLSEEYSDFKQGFEERNNLFAKVVVNTFTSGDDRDIGYLQGLRDEINLAQKEALKMQDVLAEGFLIARTGDSADRRLVTNYTENIDLLREKSDELGITESQVINRMENIAKAFDIDLSGPRIEVAEQLADAYENFDSGSASANRLAGSIADLGDASASAEDKIADLDDVLNNLFGQFFDYESATDGVYESLNDLVADVEDLMAATADAENTEGFDFLKDALDPTSFSDDALNIRASMRDLTDDLIGQAIAWADTQENLSGAGFQRKLDEQADALEEAGLAAGLSEPFIKRYSDAIRDAAENNEIAIAFNADVRDAETALEELLFLTGLVPEDVETAIKVFDNSGISGLENWLEYVGRADDVEVNTLVKLISAEAADDLDLWRRSLGLTPQQVETLLSVSLDGDAALKAYADELELTDDEFKAVIEIIGAEESDKRLGVVQTVLERLTGQPWSPTITVNTTQAHRQITNLQNRLRALDRQRIQADLNAQESLRNGIPVLRATENADGNVYGPGNRRVIFNADGNVIDTGRGVAFRSHTAQISDGRTTRVWGEPETGGEAYIPLAASKRPRSLEILGDVARRFNRRIESFADGGVLGPQTYTSTRIVLEGTGSSTPSKTYYPTPTPPKPVAKPATSTPSKTQSSGGGSGGGSSSSNSSAEDAAAAELLRYQIMNELAELGDKEFVTYLDKRIAAEQKYTQEWKSLYDERENVLDRMVRINQEKERMFYETGQLNQQQYAAILAMRISDLESFSDDWYEVWKELDDIVSQANENYDSTLTSFESNVQSHLEGVRASFTDPITALTDATQAFGQAADVSSADILEYYEHVATAGERWQASLQELSDSDINQDLVTALARSGPSSLTLAEGLGDLIAEGNSQQVNDYIARINATSEQVGRSQTQQYAEDYFGSLFSSNDIDFLDRYGISLDGIKGQAFGLADAYDGVRYNLDAVEQAALDANQAMETLNGVNKAVTTPTGVSPVSKEPIEDLYRNLLGRGSDDAGGDYWRGLYQEGITIQAISDQIKTSQEYKNKNPQADPIVQLYMETLKRQPDAAGHEYWSGLLQSGTSISAIRGQLQNSAEYKEQMSAPALAKQVATNTTTVSGNTITIGAGNNVTQQDVEAALGKVFSDVNRYVKTG